MTHERLRNVPRIRAVMDLIKELVKEIQGTRSAVQVASA